MIHFLKLLIFILAVLPVPIFDEETGIVKIEPEGETQTLTLNSWPFAFSFGALKDILLLAPDYQEKSACGKSKLNVVVDLITGSIIEVEKEAFAVDDEIIFSKIHPIINDASVSIRSLLELQ